VLLSNKRQLQCIIIIGEKRKEKKKEVGRRGDNDAPLLLDADALNSFKPIV
jgi:NAD(P)H-hydrate repair Nnr-like enzyme with NAD(P)H-hydrate dehydratase domain